MITATWNCVSTVRDCLDAVAGQSYPCVEHILIDGVSTDGTVDVLRSRHEELAVLISEPDNGIYDALNKGIRRASGDVIGFLHADDIYANRGVLSQVAAVFESDPDICAVYGDLQYVQKNDTSEVVRYWKSEPFSTKLLKWGWMPPHPTLYVRREWYERIGGFDTKYRIAADYFSILCLFAQPDFKSAYIPEVFVKMRLGGVSNRSLKSLIRKSQEDWDALRRTGVGAFGGMGALVWKNLRKISQFK